MLNFIIDIFCKDTIIGLSEFESRKYKSIYKNKYSSLFKVKKGYTGRNRFYSIDQYAYHL